MTVLLVPSATAAQVLAIVGTVVAGAAFGYGLNEVADRRSDAKARKVNRAAGLTRRQWLPFLVLTSGGAFGLSLAWAPDPAAPVLVLLGLGVAMAYSVPPLRLKERGAAGLTGAAAAQWAVPVLVIAAGESGGWMHPSAWAFALVSIAVGTRWMLVHQLGDVARDRRSGVRTYVARRENLDSLLTAIFVCELVFLASGLAWTWPDSVPAAIALGPFLVLEASHWLRRSSLPARLASYDHAPLAAYYFFALPAALAVGRLVAAEGSDIVTALLLAVSIPQAVAWVRWRRATGSAMNRVSASTHRPVVSASEPQP
jgi:4-hydroxybenzoate polyprenyltransferase